MNLKINNQKPLVSVIMNCHNGDKYLEEAIKSVIKQTYKNWEIIFWDNNSTDKSYEIAKRLEGDNKNIKLFKTDETRGKGAALSFSRNIVTTSHVVIHDADLSFMEVGFG